MAKILIPSLVAALAAGSLVFRDNDAGEDSGSKSKPASAKRLIKMDDGRELEFTERQKIAKESGVEGDNVYCQIDFDNGKTIKVLIARDSDMLLKAAGHGLEQKLGDAAAGAESTDDALEAILEVASRVNKGEWNKGREGTGGAKGASELVLAMTEYMQRDNAEMTKDQVRELLSNLTAGEKAGLRRLPDIAEIIERIKKERAPSKKDEEAKVKAAALLEGLKKGEVPVRAEEPAGEEAAS